MPNLAFLRCAFSHFRITGSIMPSSAELAAALASLAIGYDLVIELGAGSGAVTQALTQVISTEKLHVVELQEELATSLKQRYPYLRVMQASAAIALDAMGGKTGVAVVSSLPFRSLPAAMKTLTVRSVLRFLTASPDSTFIQFTYGLSEPFDASPGFRWQQVKWIFANFPPARIWTLTKADC